MDEYLIINSCQYKLKLLVDRTELDYYTDLILELCINEERYVLLKDNTIFLRNIISEFIKNVDMYNLDDRLNETKLGLLYNEYFYCIYEGLVSDNIIFDQENKWIGEKYTCFSNKNYATWLYTHNNNIIMKVTPMFKYFDEDNNSKQYLKFIRDYSDLFKTTIDLHQLEKMLNILLDLSKEI